MVPNITPTSCPGPLPPWCGNSVLLTIHLIGKNRENTEYHVLLTSGRGETCYAWGSIDGEAFSVPINF